MLPRDLATLKAHSYDDISHFHLQLAVDTHYGSLDDGDSSLISASLNIPIFLEE